MTRRMILTWWKATVFYQLGMSAFRRGDIKVALKFMSRASARPDVPRGCIAIIRATLLRSSHSRAVLFPEARSLAYEPCDHDGICCFAEQKPISPGQLCG
jgi:hypothetical protein